MSILTAATIWAVRCSSSGIC